MVTHNRLSAHERVVLIGALAGVTAVFMPWWRVSYCLNPGFCRDSGSQTVSINGITSFGLLFLGGVTGLCAVSAIRMFTKFGASQRSTYSLSSLLTTLAGQGRFATGLSTSDLLARLNVVLSLLAGFSLAFFWLRPPSVASLMPLGVAPTTYQLGLGFFIAVAAIVVALVGALAGVKLHVRSPTTQRRIPPLPAGLDIPDTSPSTGAMDTSETPDGGLQTPPPEYQEAEAASPVTAPMPLPDWWEPLKTPGDLPPSTDPGPAENAPQ